MALRDLTSILNRSPAAVMMEQMRKLYMRLYPYMVNDFAHTRDVQASLTAIDYKLEALSVAIAEHVHTVVSSPVGPGVAGPSLQSVPLNPTLITPEFALELVLPAGVPQPTGEGPPAVLPSRVGPPTEQVAIPPLNISNLTGV